MSLEASAVTAMAANASFVLVGTSDGAFVVDDGALTELEVWSDDPAVPPAIGAVTRATHFDGSIIVFAETGLYFSYGDKLLASPDGAALADLGVRDLQPYQSDELWLTTDQGMAQIVGEELTWYTIDDETEAPTFARRVDDMVVAAFGDRLYELELDTGRAFALPYELPRVTAMAAGVAGSLYIASESGLIERNADGEYTHYTLDGRSVAALTYYPKDGTFVLASDGVWVAQPGVELGGVMPISAAVNAFVADNTGQVWLGGDEGVEALPLGTPIGFADDVAPILDQYCATCHASGGDNAPFVAFDDYDTSVSIANTILTRIAKGQMPPAGALQMTGSEIDILEAWAATGTNP